MQLRSSFWAAVLIVAIILAGVVSQAFSQSVDVFSTVPAEHREQLKIKLIEFVAAHKEKNWSKVFDFLGPHYIEPYGKDEFVRKKLYSQVRRFTPKSIFEALEGSWNIEGCASFARSGSVEAGLEAYLKDGKWFFSEIWSSPPCIDCRPRSCKL
ncbi:MAG: hypothetical protein ACKVRN_12540 [Pyrinomonadaceae bacterium]